MSGVLDGLRVLDLTRQMAGPYATAMLSDYGADVVKVEGLPHGDPSRRTGITHPEGDSPLYLMWNRGKRSLAIDLRSEGGRRVLEQLVDWADVIVENFRPGVTERMGLDWETVRKRNPRLIYCSVTGFGATGPIADRPATDPLIQAMSGVMSVTGSPDGDPQLVGVPIADFTGAMGAVQGILLAVIARERTGTGQLVEVSLLGGLLSALSTRLASHWATGEEPKRFGSAHSVVVPYQLVHTKDGTAMAGTWGPGDWPRFCAALGRDDLVDDERFADNDARVANRGALGAELDRSFAMRTTAEWAERFQDAGALFAPVLTIPEVLDHPQAKELDLVEEVQHASLGPIKVMRSPVHLSEQPPTVASPPPRLGEHSWQVLRDLGFEDTEVQDMLRDGVVSMGDAESKETQS